MGTAREADGILSTQSAGHTACAANIQKTAGGGICAKTLWSIPNCSFGKACALFSQTF